LLAYTLLSFLIPFIDISTILGNNSGVNNEFIQFIPSVHQYTIALEEASQCPVPIWSTSYDKWDWTAFILLIGAGILLLRFIVRYISFIRIRNRSRLISADGIKIYQVDESIIPFSFGKSVFINSNLHTEDELREIVRHEFVHVRQNHTIDIIWAELLCIINWYNPFAWLLKTSIRQNLEFIADNKVVENGIDKKQYQYLLLKVIGNNQYSIATKFNFSSLKKRIAMMNKLKSAKRQLLRMLFLLPATAVLLLAFRNEIKFHSKSDSFLFTGLIIDAKTGIPLKNVAIIEKNFGMQTTSDEKGFFKIELPANKKGLELIVKFEKNGFSNVSLHLRTDNPSGSNIEFVYMQNLSNSTPSSSTHSHHYNGVADYNQVAALFNEYKKSSIELETVDEISRNSSDPILIHNGVPYVIGNGVKAWFDELDLKESSEFKILVDGQIMTMEEVNRTINRIDIDQAGTLSQKEALKKYNINYNLIILGLNKSGYKLIPSDTIPDVTITNSKGYYIDIKDNKGNCMVVIKDKNKKEVKRLLLTEWNEKSGYYENQYGEILNPTKVEIEKMIKASNPEIRTVAVINNIATVTLNNGKKEVYTLSLSPEKKAFENKYCLPNSALVPTESLQKVQVESEVESLAEIKEEPIKEVVVNPAEIEVVEQAITVTGVKSTVSPTITSTKPELVEVTVVGKKSMSPTKATTLVATTKPEIEEVTVVGKPTKAMTGNIVEEPIVAVQEKRVLHLGGLTILDEGQYILLDGKEVLPATYGKLTGPYRITFVDGKDAEKKYGSKGKNGAILLSTIR